MSFLAWSSYLGLSLRPGFSCSHGTDPQAIRDRAIHAGMALCLCAVPQTDPVSVSTEHCLVQSFYKIKALISISVSSIKFVCKYFPSSQTCYEWDCPLGSCHSAWLPLLQTLLVGIRVTLHVQTHLHLQQQFFPQLCQVNLHFRGGNLFVALCSLRYLEYVHSAFIHGITDTELKLGNIFLSSSPVPKRKHFVNSLFSCKLFLCWLMHSERFSFSALPDKISPSVLKEVTLNPYIISPN